MEHLLITLILTTPFAVSMYLYERYVMPERLKTARYQASARVFDILRANNN